MNGAEEIFQIKFSPENPFCKTIFLEKGSQSIYSLNTSHITYTKTNYHQSLTNICKMDDFHDLKTNNLRENVLKKPCIREVIGWWKKNSENDKTNREVEKIINDEDVAKLVSNTKGFVCHKYSILTLFFSGVFLHIFKYEWKFQSDAKVLWGTNGRGRKFNHFFH